MTRSCDPGFQLTLCEVKSASQLILNPHVPSHQPLGLGFDAAPFPSGDQVEVKLFLEYRLGQPPDSASYLQNPRCRQAHSAWQLGLGP